MVQGLAFLSKKSWHTKNFANQEKVWLAEEQKRAEEQKTKELARQIQQEREEEELDKVAGTKKKRDRGIDWMYEGGNAHSEVAKEDAKKEAEEYLLGKEFSAAQQSVGHFNAEDKNEGIYAVLKQPPVSKDSGDAAVEETYTMKDPPVASMPSVHDRNESFRMRYEDPMFAVSQRAREKQEKQQQTKALYERVTGKITVDRGEDRDKSSKSRKHSKKEKKRHKSHKKKDKKRHRDDDDDDSRSRRRKRYRSRSRSPPGRDRSLSPGRGHSRRYRRSRSFSEESSAVSSDYSRSPRDEDDRYTTKTYNNAPVKDNYALSQEHIPSKRSGYGLVGSRGDTLNLTAPDALGPDRELLETKRRLRDEERHRQRERASTRRHRTPQEREAALRAMEMDAQYQRDSRRNRTSTTNNNSPYNSREMSQEEERRHNPAFLHEARRKANGMQGETSMADRMRQNRNSNQRLDSDRFL